MEGLNNNLNTQEKKYEPFLEELWEEYGFKGKPPYLGSLAEKRLKDVCDQYANSVDAQHGKKPLDNDFKLYRKNKSSASDSARRVLHNQIAIMVVGNQRSGMEADLAQAIGEFAYEFSRGYKIGEAEKFKKNDDIR